jgi:hypothetical protein
MASSYAMAWGEAPLTTPAARDGFYFDTTLRRLFTLVAHGVGLEAETQGTLHETVAGAKETFALAPLDSRLFDDAALPLLSKVRFPNHVWQRIIKLMSLSGGNGRGRRSGRVSYQLLSINQLGAVYEGLLSFRGFFASDDLYEVMPAPRTGGRASAAADDDDDDVDSEMDGDEEAAPARRRGADARDVMEAAFFVPAGRLEDYEENERVYDTDGNGRRKLRKYEKGSFVYRLAGRDREKSASYYTPQLLTRCLVKYALKELLSEGNGRVRRADDILTLTVCEPAMGSAAFLNEAVNQLADEYLARKQQELGRRIPHEAYAQELQKVRMVLADRNVFGVDLNPVAVELAEVSLWLNAIYGETDEQKRPLPARVPWFGYQLFAGNSLIGARRQAWPASSVVRRADPPWYEVPPRKVTAAEPLAPDEIWHFLLPDPGMADYTDAVARKLYPEDFQRLKKWRREFRKPLQTHEVARLQQLSAKAEELWAEHAQALARDRARTEDMVDLWPHATTAPARERLTRGQKEAVRRDGLMNEDGDLATPFRRLKLLMDYWCALWFWPIAASAELPSREQWWMEVGAILEGNIVDIAREPELDLAPAPHGGARGEELAPRAQGLFEGFEAQLPLRLGASQAEPPRLHDSLGQLRISRLREQLPRLQRVEAIAAERRFMHWELVFADVLITRGGFDLVLGNPPWRKIEMDEAGVLGEANPLFAIRNYSATELAKLRGDAFRDHDGLQRAWTNELEEAEGTQGFLNAVQLYPILKGVQTNLYKCFMPLAWSLNAPSGVTGLLHPEGSYDDPKGGPLREASYLRLRTHFQFQNQLMLFPIAHRAKFSINIYGRTDDAIHFNSIANIVSPHTVGDCYNHGGDGLPGGIKNDAGKWNTAGHTQRIVRVDDAALEVFAQLYDEPGTPCRRARLPALHAQTLNSVLAKLASWPRRLADLDEDYLSTEMWHETMQQKDGTIIRRPSTDSDFPTTSIDWVLIPASMSFDPSSRTERCERNASSAPIRDRGRFDSCREVPDSLAFGSASGMTGETFGSLV